MRWSRLLSGLLIATMSFCARADDAKSNSMKAVAAKDWTRADAAHLLRRAAFGGTPEEIDRLTKLGLDRAVESLLNFKQTAYDPAGPPIDPIVMEPPDRAELRVMSEEERREYQQKKQMAERRSFEEIRLWWLDRLANSPRPVEEKMTLFWHGHFTSGMREVKNPIFMKEQNELLRNKALGNFRDLLLSISKDRAMLVYLDNARNVKRQPNENYARELLELFTLGVGNYKEEDIKAAARAFTGWAYDRDGYVFRRDQHDFDEKVFLGKKGKWDGDDVVDVILERNECSQFLAKKLLKFFVRPQPSKQLINAFAATIRKNKYDLRASLEVLFKSEAFYHADSRACLIKSPTELLIGASRQLAAPVYDLFGAERALASMGQELLQPPNVKGWDGGEKWINTAMLFNRYNVVGALLRGETSGEGRRMREQALKAAEQANDASSDTAEPGMMKMASQSRMAAVKATSYDPLPTLRRFDRKSAEDVVAFYEENLLAAPLPPLKKDQLIEYLRGDKNDFDLSRKDAAERVRTLLQLIVATPEFQLN